MFKNATAYQLPKGYELPGETERLELLAQKPAHEPTGLQLEAVGFGAVVEDVLVIGDHRAGLVVLESATRMLPSDVVRRAVRARCEDFEAKMGRKPGKRMRGEFQELVLTEMVPRAFVRVSRTQAYWDLDTGLVIVDSGADRASERVISGLREVFGSLPVRPLACEASVGLVLTQWLVTGQLPEGFSLGDGVVLKDPSDQASMVRAAHMDLETDEVREHARAGRAVTQLSLKYRDRIGFVLDARLKLKSIRLLDIDEEKAEGADAVTLVDGSFRIMRAELAALYAALNSVFQFVDRSETEA
jgi:recombination associated protein RdgC